jgi:hypothetical protein
VAKAPANRLFGGGQAESVADGTGPHIATLSARGEFAPRRTEIDSLSERRRRSRASAELRSSSHDVLGRQGAGSRDMIDLQSFLWVQGSDEYDE